MRNVTGEAHLVVQPRRGNRGRHLGAPFPVRHFHGSRVATAGGVSSTLGNAVSAVGFIYEAMDTRSDIWKLTRTAARPTLQPQP